MEDVRSFTVTCLKCKGKSRIKILNSKDVIWVDHEPIISARLRPDMEWGFECICGNDSRVSLQEKDKLDFLVQVNDTERKAMIINDIAKKLSAKNHLKFKMEAA
jgi:hypothetical protein